VTGARLSYRFGPLERRGLFGAVRAGQATLLAAGLIAALVTLNAVPSAGGALLGTCLLGLACAAAWVPLGRRGLDEWLPVLTAFMWRGIRGERSFRSPTPLRGVRVRRGIGSGAIELGDPEPAPPPALRGVTIDVLPYRDRKIGVLRERSGRRLTAVLACRVHAFSLLDPESQERRLSRWGLILSGAAGSQVRRIGWIERTAPAQGDELARWLYNERDPAIPLRGTPMIESYLELIGTTTRVTQEHEILVAVQIDVRRARVEDPEGMLIEQAERVANGLEAAEVTVLGALNAGQLARALRTAFDPYARVELAALEAADPGRTGLDEANAWPLGTREAWDHYRTDGAVHATYWVGAWPRIDVSPLFMDALLGRSSVVRTVAVTFEPIAPERSIRDTEAAITRDRADRELRHRFGQLETARHRMAHEATLRREAELATGHSEVRLSGFVTVSGRDLDDLRRASAEVLEHAARARLELHRMYGHQADAFTFTLPLCRGLR
jgi:hypothetical protein